MRTLLLSTAMAALLFGGGCSILQSPLETTAWIQKNEQTIESAVRAVRRVAVRHLSENPEEAREVNSRIDYWARQVQILVANGETDPDALAAALGFREEWAADVVDGLLILYRAKYDELVERDQVQLAVILLRTIADGLVPPSVDPKSGVVSDNP